MTLGNKRNDPEEYQESPNRVTFLQSITELRTVGT
jgi:hypothetical protein